jgi:hypothetical protein
MCIVCVLIVLVRPLKKRKKVANGYFLKYNPIIILPSKGLSIYEITFIMYVLY